MKSWTSSRFGLVFLIVLALPVLITTTAGTVRSNTPTTKEFIITARQWAYDPPVIEVNQGDQVVIKLRSADISHGIYIEGYDLRADLILQEGKPNEVELRFIADKPGTFVFRCTTPCGPFHPFMTGILKVNPNYNFLGASTLALMIALLISVSFLLPRR